MRRTFASTLADLAEHDSRILLLTGDLGYQALDPFWERFPKRFLNVGVAEQNMIGLATGLAEAGFLPFVYSIATFASLRGYEFIRNGPVLQRLPVRIVGVGGGFEYGHAGATHHGLEDIGVTRIQPGLMVIAPADYEQARSAILATWNQPGPVYYRLGKDERTVVPGLLGRFELGRAQLVRDGSDLLFLALGSVAADVVAAADALSAEGTDSSVAIVASINPPPVEDLAGIMARFPKVITVEAHYVTGGLGSLVAEVIAERGLDCRLVRSGVRETPDGLSGGEGYLRHRHGLSREALVELGRQALLTEAR